MSLNRFSLFSSILFILTGSVGTDFFLEAARDVPGLSCSWKTWGHMLKSQPCVLSYLVLPSVALPTGPLNNSSGHTPLWSICNSQKDMAGCLDCSNPFIPSDASSEVTFLFTRRIWAVYFLSWTSVCLVSYSGRGCTAVWALVLPWSVWLNGSSGGSPDPSLIAGIMVSCVMIYAVSTLKEMLLQYLRYLWKSNTEWWVIL